jgi:tetratricopeptide (TPR) repeat protein
MSGGAAGLMRRLPAALLAALLAACVAPHMAHAAPRLPASGAEVLEVLPWRNDPMQRELRTLRASLAQSPRDLGRAIGVARRYIELGRREADPRYFGYAQAALAPWWGAPKPPGEVRLLRASLLQTEHRFAEALADLDAVTAAEPGNAQAWLTRATVETVRADYAAATRSCARLSSQADELVTAACIANVGAMTGRLHASEALLATTWKRGAGLSPAVDAWVLGSLAEMAARRGDAAGARARYRQALALAPGDSYLLAAYADFLLEERRHDAVLALLAPHLRVDGLLLRYALALAGAHDSERLAPQLAELGARFDAGERRGDGVHLREQARFELALRGNAARAVQLAQRNWASQKELPDARVLIEAALAMRAPAAARPVLDWMKASGVEDPTLARLAQQMRGGQTEKGRRE